MGRSVYKHPDGLTLTSKANALIAADDDGNAVFLPFGATGLKELKELGDALLALAAEQEQEREQKQKQKQKITLKRVGASMGRSLIDELRAMRGKPQAKAVCAIHDKLFALSKLKHFDCAAAGFAGAIVNVLEIGVANLPAFKGGKQ